MICHLFTNVWKNIENGVQSNLTKINILSAISLLNTEFKMSFATSKFFHQKRSFGRREQSEAAWSFISVSHIC